MLKLKYKYGIFIDSYTANMLMDFYIKNKNLKKAALVAHEIMLQEMSDNELTLSASLFTCMKYFDEHRNDQEVLEETKEDSDEKKVIKSLFNLIS